MKPGNGQKMGKARLPEQIIGVTFHITPVTNEQRCRNAAGGCRHACSDFICPQLPESAETLTQAGLSFLLDMLHSHDIAACHHTTNSCLYPVVPRPMKHRSWRGIDPC